LKGKTKLNHFALKTKLHLTALHSAFSTLRQLTPVPNHAQRERSKNKGPATHFAAVILLACVHVPVPLVPS